MPFQIEKLPAFREIVLAELRKQAATPGTETYEVVQYNSDYDTAMWSSLGNAQAKQGCYDTLDKVLWYCYSYMPQHFDALQRVMQLEEEDADDKSYGDTFRKKVFSTNGDLLVIDVGCGPMTAGLALADWHNNIYGFPLKLSYIGIDDSAHCRRFAERFTQRSEIFDMQHRALFYGNCDECDTELIKTRATTNGTLLFIFSYIFGQGSCERQHLENWAAFMRRAMTACKAKHNIIAYTNSPSYRDKDNPADFVDPNAKFDQFCRLLGWQEPNLRYKTGKNYQYPKRYLKRFNEAESVKAIDQGPQSFRHLLIDATLVDEKGIPVREDRKRP
jgi:hypothetical protein